MRKIFNSEKAVKAVKIVLSIAVSLLLITGISLAWIESSSNPTVEAPLMQLAASPGLLMKIDGRVHDLISLNDYLMDPADSPFILSEMSSQTGQLLFVRIPSSDDNSLGNVIKLRTAGETDKNKNYIFFNLQLTADGRDCDIYLGDSDMTYLKSGEEDGNPNSVKPVRIFLSYRYEDEEVGTVSNSYIFATDTSYETMAVFNYDQTNEYFDEEFTALQSVHSFSEFFFGSGQKIMTLKNGITADVTLKIWLEGCDRYCVDSLENGQISGSMLDFRLMFFTPPEEEETTQGADPSGEVIPEE